MPYNLSNAQLDTLNFLTGIGPGPTQVSQTSQNLTPPLQPVAAGVLSEESGHTWRNGTIPAVYDGTGSAQKWAGGVAGTPGGTVRYAFDAGSNWDAAEQSVWKAALSLWSAVADIKFTQVPTPAQAQLMLYRDYDPNTATYTSTESYTTNQFVHAAPGGTVIPAVTSSLITIYTSNNPTAANGNGNVGSFTLNNGHGPSTAVHELGHMLGLFHAGPYDGQVDPATQQYNATDNRLWSTMSYIRPTQADARYFEQDGVTGTDWGGVDATQKGFMMLDVLAVQRLYGAPAVTPLHNVTFGFNTTINAPLKVFYDFTVDTDYIGTLYARGMKNTLDMSGWSAGSDISLTPGTFSSANGMVNNIAIAFDTVISKVIGGTGGDTITAASFAVTLEGQQGDDSLTGSGNLDRLNGGEGSDTLTGGGGNDVLSGWDGIDSFNVDAGKDRIMDLGLGGADVVAISAGAALDGRLAADWVATAATSNAGTAALVANGFDVDLAAAAGASGWTVSNGANATGVSLTGSAQADKLIGGTGQDTLFGGAGNDELIGGADADQMTGGAGNDVYAVDNSGDVVTEAPGGGVDTVRASIADYTLTPEVEKLLFAGTGGFTGTGNGAANEIRGGAGNDSLSGADGNDTLLGGAGGDTLLGGVGNDVLAGGTGADVLTGGTGNDVFRFAMGQADGDEVTDFGGNGAQAGDRLVFTGYGAGAGFTQLTATTWQVSTLGGGTVEVITFGGSPTIVSSDWSFV